ncbi:hypothetical protein [Devosia sediminis]|uniref:Uncharacterized protein n=1 Tax=Devosia sediminis TaxID=2798801 RepID=A0A934IUU7_9HYPH|nr:hypothetical protein [Devosia sediminis]MBJ3783385.1 hypothetical protein [Devosia sediminis]
MKRGVIEMVQASLKVPRGFAGYWKIIRELDAVGAWTLTMVEGKSNVGRESIRDFVRRLVKGNFAAAVGTLPNASGNGSPSTAYRLVKRPLLWPRLDRNGKELPEPQYETLWRAMKMLGTFDAAELSRLTETVTQQRAYIYLQALLGAGVIAQINPGKTRPASRFRLVNNVGSLAPMVTKAQIVFDPNSGTVLGEPQMVEVSQ